MPWAVLLLKVLPTIVTFLEENPFAPPKIIPEKHPLALLPTTRPPTLLQTMPSLLMLVISLFANRTSVSIWLALQFPDLIPATPAPTLVNTVLPMNDVRVPPNEFSRACAPQFVPVLSLTAQSVQVFRLTKSCANPPPSISNPDHEQRVHVSNLIRQLPPAPVRLSKFDLAPPRIFA